MIATVTEREFLQLLVTKELVDDSRLLITADAYRALFMYWSSRINAVDVTLIGYLISRTFGMGRLAQRISFAEFTEGTQLSKTTVREHLQELSTLGFIHIYRTAAGADGHEKEARMFEIDCNFFIDSVLPGRETHQKKAKKGVQLADPPVRETDPPSYINYIDTGKRETETSLCIPLRPSRSTGSQESNVFALPKKPRAAAARPEGIAAVLATVSGASRAKQDGRVVSSSKKAPHLIDKLEMQAILDKAMRTYHPNGIRMIVTGKEFGLLRKRLKEQPPGDFQAFVNHVIGQWFTIATQSNIALRKRIGVGSAPVKGSAMPMAPEFAALAYRYPYFLKVYANRTAEQAETKVEDDKRAAALQRQLDAANRDKALLVQQLKAKSSVIRRTPTPARSVPRVASIDDELGSADLPAWQPRERASK